MTIDKTLDIALSMSCLGMPYDRPSSPTTAYLSVQMERLGHLGSTSILFHVQTGVALEALVKILED